MFGVFQNIDPPPPHRRECVPPAFDAGGRTHSLGGEGGGGSIVCKMPYTALYSLICKYFVGSSTMSVRYSTILGIA
jgi:hypothetical protein